MENEPKISSVEIILLVFFGIIADIFSVIPGLNFVVSAVMFPGLQFYLHVKGVRGAYGLVANCIELVPVLSVLPAYTAGILLTIYVDRNPTGVGAQAVQKTAAVKTPKGGLAAQKAQ